MATTHVICATAADSGQSHRVDYWAHGEGQASVYGYAQSLDDVLGELQDELGLKDVDLLYVTPNRNVCHITTTKALQGAVEDLPHGGVLNVTVVKSSGGGGKGGGGGGGGGGKGKGKGKKKNKGKQANSDSDSEGDGPTYRVMNDEAIAKRFGATGKGWESTSPAAPLGREKEAIVREDVKHLQYLLTRLGLMELGATNKYQGSYQHYTEQAVRNFRQQHSLNTGDMTKYDKKTAAKLADEVRRML